MPTSSSTRLVMPSVSRSSTGQASGPALDRKGPLRASTVEDSSKVEADKFVARWLDAAISAWGKATAYAEQIEVDLAHVNRMRSGEKPTPLRALLPFLGNTEAVLTFVAPLLESIGYVARPANAPTFVQLAGAVLADLDDGSSITRALIERAAEKRGWTPDQVALALHRESEPVNE
jgi:hypothetical protein